MGHTTKIPMLAVALGSLLAGCSEPDVPVETARPVLVVHPSATVTHRESGRTLALFRCTQMVLYAKQGA